MYEIDPMSTDGGRKGDGDDDDGTLRRGPLVRLLLELRTDTAGAGPRVELAFVREYRAEVFVQLAVNRQALFLFPAMKGSDTAL